jgi:hypothetical protein
MENQNNQENTTFNDQSLSDQQFNAETLGAGEEEVSAEEQVRENEDASLQDKEYSFDEDLTGTEEYHDVDDFGDGAIAGSHH